MTYNFSRDEFMKAFQGTFGQFCLFKEKYDLDNEDMFSIIEMYTKYKTPKCEEKS